MKININDLDIHDKSWNYGMQKIAEKIIAEACGELIQGDVYYIGKTKPALVLHNPIFCSDECVLDYLQVDSFPVEDFDE